MTDVLSRLTAALAERYAIERELGAGGMATVYLAQDLKHHRSVAVKVLRGEIAAALGAERFTREIEVAARLQHPHILPLLDSGEAAGFYYYVMPYVGGESLRDRLAQHGELPIHDAVKLLIEVTDALAHAHSHGVVHRDIKPDNILLSGRHALVMDFGVAKAVSEATGRHTLTSIGVALGTPAYMAPEQAAADPHLDQRVDIYALGVMGYELLTGQPPFVGRTAQETLAAHMTQVPEPVSKHRPGISPTLEQVLMRCLAKRAADRWQSAEELLAQLEPLATPSGGMTPTTTRPVAAVSAIRSRMVWWAAAASVGVLGFVAWRLIAPGPPVFTIGRTDQLTADPGLEIQPALSPDGKLVAYAAGNATRMRVFIRPVGGGRTLPLTDDSTAVEWQPRWSPDGNSLLFLTRGGVAVAPALGGTARPVVAPSATDSVVTAAWSPDGREIAFVRGDSLLVAQLTGGGSRLVAAPAADWHSCNWSPQGKLIACVSQNGSAVHPGVLFGNLAPSAIVLVPAAGGTPLQLVEPQAFNQSPVWTPDGRSLLFISNRDGLRDVYTMRLAASGHPRGALSRLTTGLGAISIALSANGRRLAYSVYAARANIWSLPIPGGSPITAERATPVTTGNQVIESMRVSPDHRWLLFDSDLKGNSDIYRLPITGGPIEQLTDAPADEFAPDLSPDGRELAYHSWRTGTRDIEVKPIDGGPVERVTATPAQESYPRWSPDGRVILFYDQASPAALLLTQREANGRWSSPTVLARSASTGVWSPDGRSIAYVDQKPGAVLIVPAAGGAPRRVFDPSPSAPGGELVEWSPDGRTLYYKSHDFQGHASFWAVPAAGGHPRLLVRFTDLDRPSFRSDLATDGKRFYFAIQDRQSDIFVAELTERK